MWCDGTPGCRFWSGFTGYFCGGGLSVPYQQGEEAVDTEHYYGLWNAAREQIARHLGHPVKLEIEPGRFLVAQSGVLITQVRSVKQMGRRHFVLVDAGFNDLMRPAMYGSYHHISALAADGTLLNMRQRWKLLSQGHYVSRAMSLPSRKGECRNPRLTGSDGWRLSGAA